MGSIKMRILAFPAFSNEKTNPYQALLYRPMGEDKVYEFTHKRAFFGRFDVIHFHWPDLYIRSSNIFSKLKKLFLLSAIVIWNKIRGVKIVWTAHNLAVKDTGFPKLTDMYLNWFIKQCDGLIFLTHISKELFEKKYKIAKKTQTVIIPHGHYRDVYKSSLTKTEARENLGLPQNKKILLFFGLIRPYKNVIKLIEDFISLNDKETCLVIAGSALPDMEAEIRKLTKGQDNIFLFIEFVPDEKVGLFFSSADIVVLPFEAILNSGSTVLALSFDRKIIAPNLGSIRELREMVGKEWIYMYEGDFNKSVLENGIKSLSLDVSEAQRCPLDPFNWEDLSRDTYSFYERLLSVR